ncbi:unnamed protein product [Thlaspi arvense]|uniref:GATA-type domain-containing protein n=1 Tax=Thlaspi arvense TaxID=13288 RepID=A0AAU9S9S7_THLAR|nr:unnamed protein product [Thlaspi arvense]
MNNGDPWIREEDDDFKGLGDNFFDDLINHLDFPLEDIETANGEGDWDADFKNLVPPSLDVLTSLSSEFSGGNKCNGQRVRGPNTKPALKQSSSSEVSSTVESSLPDVKVSKLFQSSSPVSVLESANGSVSFQNPNRAHRLAFLVKGIRGKRKRPTELRFGFLKSFASAMAQKFAARDDGPDSENPAKKKRRRNKNGAANSDSSSPEPYNDDGTLRKCTHCETTKTPQWREGPSGPKTLCNACGVRFRSGRLVPEYRPASSPTFIPTVHSNSHRRIIEMRRKDEEDQFETGRIRSFRSRA